MARLFVNASQEYLVGVNPVSGYPFSMGCWFWVNSVAIDYGLMDLTDASASAARICLFSRGAAGGDPLTILASSSQYPTSNSITANAWHYALGIFATDSSKIVVLDGDWANRGTNAGLYDPFAVIDRMDIARLGDSTPSSWLDGKIAEAAVWDVALDQAQCEALAKGYSPLLVRKPVFYAPLIRDEDQDIVGALALATGGTPEITEHPRVFRGPLLHLGLTSGLPATADIQLDWTDVSENEDGFSIERATDAGAFGEIDTVGAGIETYDDEDLPLGHTYHYRVRATSATLGYSEYSNEADVIV